MNLPWVVYGCDFGANRWQPQGGMAQPDRRARAQAALGQIAASGARAVRWFLFCDGRSGLRAHAKGAIEIDDHVPDDIDVALGLVREAGLAVIFVLFDFKWFSWRRVVEGVQLGGRTRLLGDATARRRVLAGVVEPVLERHGRDPAILAWEVINEPEWATGRLPFPGRRLARRRMRALVRDVATLIHARTEHQVTVGSASAATLPLVAGLGLDFYQVHWYDRWRVRFDLGVPAAGLGMDRPVVIGEFPTRRSRLAPRQILDAARSSGYAGAFAWSLLANDGASDGDALIAALQP